MRRTIFSKIIEYWKYYDKVLWVHHYFKNRDIHVKDLTKNPSLPPQANFGRSFNWFFFSKSRNNLKNRSEFFTTRLNIWKSKTLKNILLFLKFMKKSVGKSLLGLRIDSIQDVVNALSRSKWIKQTSFLNLANLRSKLIQLDFFSREMSKSKNMTF